MEEIEHKGLLTALVVCLTALCAGMLAALRGMAKKITQLSHRPFAHDNQNGKAGDASRSWWQMEIRRTVEEALKPIAENQKEILSILRGKGD